MIPSIVLYLELHVFAIAILLVIVFNMRRQDRHSFDQRLFFALLAVNILLLFFDAQMRTINGLPGSHIRFIYTSTIVIYNILNPVMCMLWYYYVDYYVYNSNARIYKLRLPIVIPVAVNAVLSVASIFTNIYFVFDENNVYSRGRFIYILLGICLYIVIYTSVFLFVNRKRIPRKEFTYLIFFAIPPAVGGVVQILIKGLSVIWIAAALSVYVIFINIQKDQIETDYLTGVHNRRHLDSFLRSIEKNRRCELIAGIMIDINSFKKINDVYGHDHGDQALRYTAQILMETFRKKDFIARYGGDEFVVIMELDNPSKLELIVQRLKNNMTLFNLKKLVPYEITLSVGYDYYNKDSETSLGEFLKKLDNFMYEDKRKIREKE